MTTQELRELDAWIAENVFGFSRHQQVYGLKFEKGCLVGPNGDIAGWWNDDGFVWHAFHKTSNYTTNPAAAMEVLEKCLEFDNNILLWRGTDDMPCDLSGDVFVHMNKFGPVCHTHAKSLPLAICLFAKKLFSKETA